LGSFGDISTISFDYLKNITCDEGGGISINNSLLVDKFEQTYYFGTNKARFLKGDTSFYEWKSKGTNALLAEPLAYILYKQVFESQHIIETYKKKWQDYYDFFKRVEQKGDLELAEIPQYAESNGHIFWIKTENENTRKKLMNHLFRKNIQTAFHYTPLHTSEFGKKMGVFRGEDKYTTKESARLLRLPLYYDLSSECQMRVIKEIESFYTDL
jgi:dTDP-4-amino-4,6-dideoxygalactose transaminase